MLRTTRALAVLVALAAAGGGSASAGELVGVVRVAGGAAAAAPNPYPGQVGAAADSERGRRGLTTPADAVVSLKPVASGKGGARPPRAAASWSPELRQRGQAFVPRVLAVPVGAVVEFPNDDPFYHNVFSYSATKRFDLGRYGKGKSRTVTFDRPGLVKVFCDIHSDMAAYILVLDTPHFAAPSENGDFAVRGVPPGDYEVTAWHPDFAAWSGAVTIPAQGTATLEIELR
jgi:plastocyanin